MPKFYRDALERVIWTAVQAGLGVVSVELLNIDPVYGVVVAAVLATLKALVARQLGVQGTASTAPGV